MQEILAYARKVRNTRKVIMQDFLQFLALEKREIAKTFDFLIKKQEIAKKIFLLSLKKLQDMREIMLYEKSYFSKLSACEKCKKIKKFKKCDNYRTCLVATLK